MSDRLWSRHIIFVVFLVLLVGCGSNPAPPPPTRTVEALMLTPTSTLSGTAVGSDDSTRNVIKAGELFIDETGDMDIEFMDVVSFVITVDEQDEEFEAIFTLRDIPSFPVPFNLSGSHYLDYIYSINVYLDPNTFDEILPDYAISMISQNGTTNFEMGNAPGSDLLGDLFVDANVIEQERPDRDFTEYYEEALFEFDYQFNTLTIRGQIPGLNDDALVQFYTYAYPDHADLPGQLDQVAEGSDTATPTPTPVVSGPASSEPVPTPFSLPAGGIWGMPGPPHYAGDNLTLVVYAGDDRQVFEDTTAQVRIDGGPGFEHPAIALGRTVELRGVFDTTGQAGPHEITIELRAAGLDTAATYTFEVLTAEQKPEAEANAVWESQQTTCCILHYLTGTAAARDIEYIAGVADRAALDFEATTGTAVVNALDVYFIDRMWNNGAFGGAGEIVASYYDRAYGPGLGESGLHILLLHEMTHATWVDRGGTPEGTFPFKEGMAVFVAGGHYQPEPLPARAAALYQLGWHSLFNQARRTHELGYLEGATVAAFLADRYGFDGLVDIQNTIDDDSLNQYAWLEAALLAYDGTTWDDFLHGYQDWLSTTDPGDQIDNLRYTIDLQELRRQYQARYAPFPFEIFGAPGGPSFNQPNDLAIVIREPNQPLNVALEWMLAHAQQAVIDSDYDRAGQLMAAVQSVLDGNQNGALFADYLAVAEVVDEAGYVGVGLELTGDTATVEAIRVQPTIDILRLTRDGEGWRIDS